MLDRPDWLTPPHKARHPFDDTFGQLHPTGTGLQEHDHLIADDLPHEMKQLLGAHIGRWHRTPPTK